MNDDLISRQDAKVAMRKLKKWYVVCEEHTQKNIGLRYDDVMFTLDKLPSTQPEHLVKESGNLAKGLVNDCISRQTALQAMDTWDKFGCDPHGKLVRYDDDTHYIPYVKYEDMVNAVKNLPSQPEHTETHECDYQRTETHDLVSRSAVLDALLTYFRDGFGEDRWWNSTHVLWTIKDVPSVQLKLSDAYMKAVYTWLLDYQIKAAELKGRYTPYEVLSWVINDWRKEHE